MKHTLRKGVKVIPSCLLVVTLLLLLPLGGTVAAQTTTGGLRGVVTDAMGAVIPGASVVAKNVATGVEYKTTATGDGVYTISRIPPGSYSITVEVQGFKKAEFTGIEVGVGKDTVVDVRLEPGAITEVVTVTGGGEVLMEKDSAQISATIQSRKIQDLPINVAGGGLDFVALLLPGVRTGFGNVNANGVTLSVNGNRARSNNFTIDGVDNNDLSIGGPNYFVQNRDLIQEYQVITNNFSAEYGRNQGAIVNIVSKSGTNEFHGTVAWYHRDQKLWDSLTNLERRSGQQKDPVPNLVNVFDYTIGGPIVRNKVFFFHAGHFIRNPQFADLRTTALAPTPEGIQMLKSAFPNNQAVQYYADFSAFALPIGNPTIRPDVPTSTITIGNLKVPVAAVRRAVPLSGRLDEINVRGDVHPSDRDRIWGRYFIQDRPGKDFLVDVRGWTGDIPFRTQQAGGGWTRNISVRSVNEFRFNYSRLFVIFGGGGSGGKGNIPHPDKIDTALTFLNPTFRADNGAPLLSVGPATNLPQGRTVESFQFNDNFTLTVGRHQLKMGIDIRRLRNAVPFLPNVNGAFTFSTAQRLADNAPNFLTVALGPASLKYNETDQFYFFQDDWRIRPNLTLNLGLRYENTGQPLNLMNDITTARERDPQKAFWRQDLPVEARVVPRVPTDNNNFAPRFGFVYTPRWGKWLFGEDKTVIRGGYGIAYDPAFYNLMLNISTSSPLVFLTTVTNIAVPDPVPTGDKVRDAAIRAGVIRFNTFDPRFFARTVPALDFKQPYVQQWSFGLQRELVRENVLEVRYVGNHQVGQFQTVNFNPFIGNLVTGFGPVRYVDPADNQTKTLTFPGFPRFLPQGVQPLTCTDNPATADNEAICNGRLFPSGVARVRINGASASHNGLQLRLDGRVRQQWTYTVSYTWSHTIDNSSEVFNFDTGNSVTVAQNPLNITRAERGNSGFDVRHLFAASWIWDLPFLREQRGWLGRILGGWQFNGILRIQDGQWFTPVQQALVSPYEDQPFIQSFIGRSHLRPFNGSPSAAVDRVGIADVDACVFYRLPACGSSAGVPILRSSPTGFWLLNDLNRGVFTPVTPSDVRVIVNGPGAAQRFGTPFGTLGRNTFKGDRFEGVDLSIFKSTRITERVSIQYRLNLFNAFNHPFFGIPNSIFVEQAGRTYFNFQENNGGRRTIEMALKIIF